MELTSWRPKKVRFVLPVRQQLAPLSVMTNICKETRSALFRVTSLIIDRRNTFKLLFKKGLRLLNLVDIVRAIKIEIPPLTPVAIINSKFMFALQGLRPFTLILQRGFRQYGQPHVD